MGATDSQRGNQATRGSMVVALEATYPVPVIKGDLFANVAYRTFRSYDHEVTKFGVGYASTGAVGQITRYMIDPRNGRPSADIRFDSADLRRDNLDGVNLEMGYRRPIFGDALQVHAGLNLSFMRSEQYVTAALKIYTNRAISATGVNTATVLGREDYYTEFSTRSSRLGMFVGARSYVTSNVFIEGNLALLGYSEINFIPMAYSGQTAHTETKTRTKGIFEISAGLKF